MIINIVSLVILVTILIVLKYLIRYYNPKKHKNIARNNIVCFNKNIKIIFLILTISLPCEMALLWFFLTEQLEELIALSIFIAVLWVFCLWILIYIYNWKIIIKQDTFVYTNFWGKSIEYGYENLRVSFHSHKTIIYSRNKKLLKISVYVKNYDRLSNLIINKSKEECPIFV